MCSVLNFGGVLNAVELILLSRVDAAELISGIDGDAKNAKPKSEEDMGQSQTP